MARNLSSLVFGAILMIFGLGGCATSSPPSGDSGMGVESKPPEWIMDSTVEGGRISAVGSAKPHVRGSNAQRELAISRAIQMIARQMGSVVSTTLRTEDRVSGNTAQSSMESISFQTTDNVRVTAEILGVWQDPGTNEIFVWMATKQ